MEDYKTLLLEKSKRSNFDRRSPHHHASALPERLSPGVTQTWDEERHTHPENYPRPFQKAIGSRKKSPPTRPMVLLIQGEPSYWLEISIDLNIVKVSAGSSDA